MTQYQVTLNEQTLQRLFTSDHQLAQLLESILNKALDAQVSEQVQRSAMNGRTSGKAIATGTSRVNLPRASAPSPCACPKCVKAASLLSSSPATNAANRCSS
jgi:hypothetical protein